jgi:RNA polymerase sigma-70 factor (ECF subfamily)
MSTLCEAPTWRTKEQRDEDADLLTDFLEHNGDGLVQKYHRWIVACFLHASSSIHLEDAENLAQDLWLHVREKADGIRDRGVFRAWLMTTIKRQAINFCKRVHRLVLPNDNYAHERVAPDGDPTVPALLNDRATVLRTAIASLCPDDQEVLTRFHFRGQSLIEMAREVRTTKHPDGNTPIGTIKRRLHVARKRLGEEIKRISPSFQES